MTLQAWLPACPTCFEGLQNGAVACSYPLPEKDYVLLNVALLDELQEAAEALGCVQSAVV